MSLAWTLIDRDRRAEFGGSRKLAMSVLTDIPLAALMAPAMMVTQIGILIGLLSGKPSGWAAQRRDVAAISAREALGCYRPHVVTGLRSEEHTSELQSLMRISYAVFCWKKKQITDNTTRKQHNA